jgi:hypothetical protein
MTDRADVDVRLVALELLLCHVLFAPLRLSMNWTKLSNLRALGLAPGDTRDCGGVRS